MEQHVAQRSYRKMRFSLFFVLALAVLLVSYSVSVPRSIQANPHCTQQVVAGRVTLFDGSQSSHHAGGQVENADSASVAGSPPSGAPPRGGPPPPPRTTTAASSG